MSISLLVVAPAYASKTIHVTKELDIRKDLLAKTLEDPKSYREIFPALVRDVRTNSDDKSRVKFVIDAMGTRETDVKLSKQSGTFVVEILSGDLKGSKITTTLKERSGFGGEPNGGTTVKCTMILEYGGMVSLTMAVIGNSQIEEEVGNGFYKLSEYAKKKYPQENLVNVDYKKNTPKLEAAKKLDPQKEAKKIKAKTAQSETAKIQKKETKSKPKLESAKTLNFEKEMQSAKPKIIQKEPEIIKETKPAPKYSFLSLDPLPASAKIGDTVAFSGRLYLLGTNPQGATIYIKDEDPLGGDDVVAGGIVDSSGRFYITWTVENMDADSVADIYAVFEGSDVHPRITTCGSGCSNTIQLTTFR